MRQMEGSSTILVAILSFIFNNHLSVILGVGIYWISSQLVMEEVLKSAIDLRKRSWHTPVQIERGSLSL